MKRAPLEMHAWEFHTSGEIFLAETAHDAVQMWRAGYRGLLSLEPGEPRELPNHEVVQGITIGQWRRLGQRGIVDRRF